MSRSQKPSVEHVHDYMTILIGSAIRLLRGEAGVFVIVNEAFDPHSNIEYTLYRLNEMQRSILLERVRGGERGGREDWQKHEQPNSARLLVCDSLSSIVAAQLYVSGDEDSEDREDDLGGQQMECCSLFVYDQAGMIGILHYLRLAGCCSCFEEQQEVLSLFVAQLAAGVRSTLKSQSLLKEQARLEAIFKQSTEGILTVDGMFRIIDFNPAMERLTGWHESDVLGRFYHEVLRPQARQGNDLRLKDSPIFQAFTGQRVVNREMGITARDGQHFDVTVTVSLVRAANDEAINSILTVRDITREREQEEQRSTFISVISHELQTPIAIIKGYASTLARTDATLEAEALRSRLRAIEEEADRLNKLVGNLLYASRIQAGGLQMEIAPLDLGNLIEGVIRRLQARFPDMTVMLDLPPQLPTVMADRDRIEEVLQNLLENAIKYSPRERIVTVSCHVTGEEVSVSVSDKGMGISLRDQEQIFERFQRIQNSTTQAVTGAGLGLYICRAIVEAHGGHIRVESTLREGSTFSFSLPRVEKAQLPMVVFEC